MNCGWSYGSRWQKIISVIKTLFKYKCSSVRRHTLALGRRLEHDIEEEKGFWHLRQMGQAKGINGYEDYQKMAFWH